MKKEEKLKIAFDFIADYLSDEIKPTEEVSKEVSELENAVDKSFVIEKEDEDDSIKRAYSIIMKLEGRDKEKAKVKQKVNEAVNPIRQELQRLKDEFKDKLVKDKVNLTVEEFEDEWDVRLKSKESLRPIANGVTFDDEGNLLKVRVPTLPQDVLDVIDKAEPMTLDEWDKLKEEENNPPHNED
tara:strand:- start:878 stop:1429 length:552 start_codon:yes stop_codon:yes gene_type:complete